MEKYYHKVSFEYEFSGLIASFNYKNSYVNCSAGDDKLKTLIEITSFRELNEFTSTTEVSRYFRSNILVIQSIITFFTGIPFTVYSNMGSTEISSKGFNHCDDLEEKLFIGNEEFTKHLSRILYKMKSENDFIVTLLDRWRKAIFLRDQSVDANLYHDESILNYFHILEQLSLVYGKNLKLEIENKTREFLKNIYTEKFYLNSEEIKTRIDKNNTILNSILLGGELTLSQKVKYYLDKYNILDPIVSQFVDETIRTRNAIAHGRQIYSEIVYWPVPPFFCIAKNSYEIIENLKWLTAKMISLYLGIELWSAKWEESKQYLLPNESKLSEFLNNSDSFFDIGDESLFIGNKYNITWFNIYNYMIKNSKKYNLKRIEKSLKVRYLKCDVESEYLYLLFEISILFSDSTDIEISEKAKNIVLTVLEKQLPTQFDKKDTFHFLEYNGINCFWYREYINSSYN